MPKGTTRGTKKRTFSHVGDDAKPSLAVTEVPKKPKKVALASVRIVAEPVAPVQTPLVVRKPFKGQTHADITAINASNKRRPGWKAPKRLEPDLSPGLKKMGVCGTVF